MRKGHVDACYRAHVDRAELVDFLRKSTYAVEATSGPDGAPQAAVVGVVVSERGEDLDRLKKLYFARFPDGTERERWPDIAYVRVTPAWIRSSDFAASPPKIEEARADALA